MTTIDTDNIPNTSANGRIKEVLEQLIERTDLVTNDVTITVGTTPGFHDFHTAMDWACNVAVAGNPVIEIELPDGDHVVGHPDTWHNDTFNLYCYGIQARTIRIYSLSGDPTLCKLSMPLEDQGDNWPIVFNASHGAYFYFSKIGFDPSDNGYPYASQVQLAVAAYGSLLWLSSVKVNGVYSVMSGSSSCEVVWRTLLTDTISNIGGNFMQVTENSRGWCYVQAGSLTLNTVGGIAFRASTGSNIVIPSANLTLTSVATNYAPATLREIDYEGSFVTDGAGALSFKA